MNPIGDDDLDLAALASVRRRFDLIWLALAAVLFFVGARSPWGIWGGFFFALPAVFLATYTHCLLFNPRGGRKKVIVRLHRLAERQSKTEKSVLWWNGWLFILTAPVVLLVAMSGGYDDFGPIGAFAGLLVGLAWGGVGVVAVRWSKRQAPPRYLRSLQELAQESDNSEQPPSPAPPDQLDH